MIGIDEVGRGAWAGPLLVCAARLNQPVIGLKDSKKLTKKQREHLAGEIYRHADIGYGWVSASEIDKIGLAAALRTAAGQAVSALSLQNNEQIIIDGTVNFLPGVPNVSTQPKADDTVPAVSAASIVAKVTRDAYMAKLAAQYKEYGFENHVGYGTVAHRQAIKQYGICHEHRKTFNMKPI